ncbi:MAG: hypothetical protein AAF962_17750 [Actinomycetota bacterium]
MAAALGVLGGSCTRPPESGRLDDPAGVVDEFTIEAVTLRDDRVVALDPPPVRDGGLLAQFDGRNVQLLFRPVGCPLVPSVSVQPNGEQIEIELRELPEQAPCANDVLIFVDLRLSREFPAISTARI